MKNSAPHLCSSSSFMHHITLHLSLYCASKISLRVHRY
jgi:hypothetical protein